MRSSDHDKIDTREGASFPSGVWLEVGSEEWLDAHWEENRFAEDLSDLDSKLVFEMDWAKEDVDLVDGLVVLMFRLDSRYRPWFAVWDMGGTDFVCLCVQRVE